MEKTVTKRYYIKYTFDPENKMLTWKDFSEDAKNERPKYGKVMHLTGRKYYITYPGKHTQEKLNDAYCLLKKFYADKLNKAAKELDNAANALSFFYTATIGESDGA